MGLTTKELQNHIVKKDPPHYFEVRDTRGDRYCHCGSEKDAKKICERNWAYDFTYVKIYLGETPQTVDVSHVSIPSDPELPEQKILPESNLQELKL